MTAPESKIASIALAQSGAERKGLEVTLMTGQIDLWPIALPQPGDDSFANRMMVCERGLSNDERIRAKRYEPRRRAEFVITRGTMREILRRYTEQQTSRLVFQVGPFGKPSLANSTIRFNLTHTAGLAMLAVSRHHEIGIDIERNRSSENALEIAECFFSANDVASLRRLPRENGDPSLFSCDGRQGKPCSRLAAKRSTNWDGLVSCSLMRAQKFVKRAFLSDNRCGGSGQLDRLLKLSARSLSTLPDYASSSNSSGKRSRSDWAGL